MIKIPEELDRQLDEIFKRSQELEEPAYKLAEKCIKERITVDDLKAEDLKIEDVKEDRIEELRERVKQTLLFTANQPIELNFQQQEEVLSALEKRLSQKPKHYTRPEGVESAEVRMLLSQNPKAIFSLYTMQRTGGEPDVIAVTDDAFIFGECSAESPDRRDFNYLEATGLAKFMGVKIMSEETYRKLQESGEFDKHSWSMLETPPEILKSNQALMGDRIGGEVTVQRGVARGRGPEQGRDPRQGWRGVVSVPRK